MYDRALFPGPWPSARSSSLGRRPTASPFGSLPPRGLHARRVHVPVVITALALTLARRRRGARVGRLLRRGVEGGRDPHAGAVQRDGDRVGKTEVLAGQVREGQAEPVRQEGEKVVADRGYRRLAGGQQRL